MSHSSLGHCCITYTVCEDEENNFSLQADQEDEVIVDELCTQDYLTIEGRKMPDMLISKSIIQCL